MSDDVFVCTVILALSILVLFVAALYLFCCIAILRMEEYQKNEEKSETEPEKGRHDSMQ